MVKHFWRLWDQMNFAFVMNSLSLSLGGGGSQQLNELREQKAMWENGRERERESVEKLLNVPPTQKRPFENGMRKWVHSILCMVKILTHFPHGISNST
jgi:hypothetical protein